MKRSICRANYLTSRLLLSNQLQKKTGMNSFSYTSQQPANDGKKTDADFILEGETIISEAFSRKGSEF